MSQVSQMTPAQDAEPRSTEPQSAEALLRAEVSRHRRTLQDMEASVKYSRALFEVAQAGLLIVDLSTMQVMDVNHAAAQILGVDESDLVGNLVDTCGMRDICVRLSTDGVAIERHEVELTRRDGCHVRVNLSLAALHMDSQRLAVMSFIDISESVRAREELRQSNHQLELANVQLNAQRSAIVQSEKMASIGQLAAGVAHEINNPIGYIASNISTMSEYADAMRTIITFYRELESLPEGDPARVGLRAAIAEQCEECDIDFILADIDGIMSESVAGTVRVTDIVQNLKSFARDDSPEKAVHDLNEGVEAMLRMVWNELKYCCTVDKQLGEIPHVMCHIGKINQVIMNMLVNAAHAIGAGGGTITIRTFATGDDVVIEIADTGCGMSPETMARIFEPFYTTKDVGKGTGLGLSISHGIVTEHGGHIEVESEVGAGSKFRIILPSQSALVDGIIG
ncbi:MAG: PAS domain S-box protein [bacterium]|nr:PAS domain S-box protein [bacterium]MBP6770615.1 PAS domain S-box protein [Reyranella sp.]